MFFVFLAGDLSAKVRGLSSRGQEQEGSVRSGQQSGNSSASARHAAENHAGLASPKVSSS